jgi:DNA-binding response OmpR family regulator
MNTTTEDRRILIVDDEPNVRLVFRTALAAPGYSVATADDGQTGLAMAGETRFDLILLDLQMPGLNGMEVLERLRESGSDVPVVIVTAHGKIPDVVRAMRLGAIDFVAKPLTPDTLRRTVADVLQRHTRKDDRGPDTARTVKDEPVTAASQFVLNLTRAKRAINLRALDEAEVFLKQAVALDPGAAEAHNLMGVVHESRNRHDEAYREYRAALKADRHYEPARHNMTRYYERFTFGHTDLPLDTGDPDPG